jgi:competence protein ComEC
VVTAVPGQSGLATRDGWRVAWRVLTPAGAPVPLTPPESDDSDVVNESSVAVVAELAGPGGDLRAVLLGDLETQGQRALAERLTAGLGGLGGPVDVVKVAHHGSAKQHEALYRSLDARVALIGVGAGNDYGHPAPSALALLRRAGLVVLRTDLAGDLAVAGRPDGGLRLFTTRESG